MNNPCPNCDISPSGITPGKGAIFYEKALNWRNYFPPRTCPFPPAIRIIFHASFPPPPIVHRQPKYVYGKTTQTNRRSHRQNQCSPICGRSEHVGDDDLFVMGPHAKHFNRLGGLQHLVDQPMLNVDSPGIGTR